MDSLKLLLYTLGRIGIFIAVNIFAVFSGEILIPALSSFFPDKSAASLLVRNSTFCSAAAWCIILIFMLVLFFDDGKRHSAYDIWSSVNIIIVLVLIMAVYFVPTIFYDKINSEGRGKAFYSIAYFPVKWLRDKFDMKYTSSALVGVGLIVVLIFAVYLISYKVYMKKHKSLYK